MKLFYISIQRIARQVVLQRHATCATTTIASSQRGIKCME